MGVTSYYQHSQGGKGKYIEKKMSSVVKTCAMNIKISELPLWLEQPQLYRRKGIFTDSGLTSGEKSILRNIEWDWLGKEDETTDIGNLISPDALVLVELKNRVDSGGTAGRREIWTKKFKTILDFFFNNTVLYSYQNKKYSLSEFFRYFKINKLELYVGILFNIDGTPATRDGDRLEGFYSSNAEGYRDLKNFLSSNPNLKLEKDDSSNLFLKLALGQNNFEIKVGALYGNQIPKALFHQDYSVTDLLVLKYDDMWLSQLIAIDERAFLLKNNKNFSTILQDLLKRNAELRRKYDELISSECKESALDVIVTYLLTKYPTLFGKDLVPNGRKKKEYLGDVVQVLCASDA